MSELRHRLMKGLVAVPRRSLMGIPERNLMGKQLLEFEEAKRQHAAHSAPIWRTLFFYTGLPIIAALVVNAYLVEKAHFDHLAHHPPTFKDLPHLHIRSKPFPWGDGNKSLFYNPATQPLKEN